MLRETIADNSNSNNNTATNTTIDYIYGVDGIIGLILKQTSPQTNPQANQEKTYYYIKNLQGDITHIVDDSGNVQARYQYDAWGNHKVYDANGNEIANSITNPNHIGNLNPIRYRGYYFDTETGMYYLKSRYYDPQVGRFLNADSIEICVNTQSDQINGLNLYAYCMNNPVMLTDAAGYSSFWENLWKVVVGVVIIAGLIAGTILTGGTLSVALAGASIGAVGGAIGATASTILTGDWDNFGNSFLIGTVAGGVSGAVGGTVIGTTGQIWINAFIELISYSANTWINGDNPTLGGLMSSFLLGGFAGKIGGAGMLKGDGVAKSFVKSGRKNFLPTFVKQKGTLTGEAFNAVIIGGVFDGFYSRFLNGEFNKENVFLSW